MVNLNCILATYLEWWTESAPTITIWGRKAPPEFKNAYSWVLVSETWICLPLVLWMICMLKTATMIIKDIRKWRLRRTSTNFNEPVDFRV